MNKKICRLCLTYSLVSYSLLEDNISEMLEALTSIKVDSVEEVSTIICTKCFLNLKLAFKIQQNILKADEKLKKIKNLNNIEIPDLHVKSETLTEFEPQCSTNTSCIICATLVKENLINKHIQQHFDDKQFCDFCNKSFSNIDEYKSECKHFDHKCEYCGTTFHYRSLYNTHVNRAHNFKFKIPALLVQKWSKPEATFTCSVCSKELSSKRHLNNHLHSHQKKKCPICDAEITVTNFKKHVMNHTCGPQICELCGATLKNLESLKGHFHYTHNTTTYSCDQCDKVYSKRYTYLIHKKKHAGLRTHVCESCGKSFLTLHYLNNHIKTAHLKLRPHICQYCNKRFSSKFALTTHVRQHTNETPYKCEMCGDGFRQNVSLRAHRRSKHNIVEPKTCACKVCGKEFSSDQAIDSHMRLH